jgi:hypothetical protein
VDEPQYRRADPKTRLGQLQRGRGAGFLAAVGDPSAGDEVLQCVLSDPRVDQQVEWGAAYYADLMIALALPVEPLRRAMLHRQRAELPHEVLAACWQRGYEPARRMLATEKDQAVIDHVTWAFWFESARADEMPYRVAKAFQGWHDRRQSADTKGRRGTPTIDAAMSVAQLLDLAAGVPFYRRGPVLAALVQRNAEADRRELAYCVEYDEDLSRVSVAATVLGRMGDDRLLRLVADYCSRARLSRHDGARRASLRTYVSALPPDLSLPLARDWHSRGDDWRYPARFVLRQHAEAADREWLEAFVVSNLEDQGGWEVVHELEALAHIADPRTAPVFVKVCEEVVYSHARSRALLGLARMLATPGARALVREALWDRYHLSFQVAVEGLPELDEAAHARIAGVAADPLVFKELQQTAARRLAGP